MLRRAGYTPNQLRNAYEQEMKKPYEEQEIVKLFGKPPYEFLGEVPDRYYPVYENFVPQLYDRFSREYQRTDDPGRFFVRIPLRLTRGRPADAKYEDYIGFPKVDDLLILTTLTTELAVRVKNVPYKRGYAVSDMFVDVLFEIPFIPDFIDQEGRYIMRCDRDRCFLLNQSQPHSTLPDTAVYYVRPPKIFLQPDFAELAKTYAARSGLKNGQSPRKASSTKGKRKRKEKGVAFVELIADIFCSTSEPYAATDDPDKETSNSSAPQSQRRNLNTAEFNRRKKRVLELLHGQDLEATQSASVGNSLLLYNFHNNTFFSARVTGVLPDDAKDVCKASQLVEIIVDETRTSQSSV